MIGKGKINLKATKAGTYLLPLGRSTKEQVDINESRGREIKPKGIQVEGEEQDQEEEMWQTIIDEKSKDQGKHVYRPARASLLTSFDMAGGTPRLSV